MNVIEALKWRYAVRRFSAEKLEERTVQELLEATRLSATSYGLQPYRMVVIDDIETRKRLLPYAMGQDKVAQCSHLVILAVQADVGDEMVDRYIESVTESRRVPPEKLNGLAAHMKEVFAGMDAAQKREWAHQQAYIALGTLLTSAALMKIDSCPMTGFEHGGFDHVLGLAEIGLESSVICALGVRHPEDENASLPKVRYEQSDMVIAL
jgi:nitroreductase